MKFLRLQRRTVALVAILAPLLLLFIYVALRSGPLASVAVTVSTVESRPIAPALAGIGTVQARFIYKIGPTVAGRVKQLDVDVGDTVKVGQVLGEMDEVDLEARIRAQQAAIKRAEAVLLQDQAKESFAKTQAARYEKLLAERGVSEETVVIKRQEFSVAKAVLLASQEEAVRLRSELEALQAQRQNLKLIAPVAGLVVARDVNPGTTVVAGQAVIELIDITELWVDTRFDQISAEGLEVGLPAEIVLRSRRSQPVAGQVLRIEPRADAITEEMLAKVIFNAPPEPLPPLGELAEVTVKLDALPAAPTIPNAAIRTVNGKRGVWKLTESGSGLIFTPIVLGRSNLDGAIQVLEGLSVGDQIVLYSEKTLSAKSRIHIVERLSEVSP